MITATKPVRPSLVVAASTQVIREQEIPLSAIADSPFQLRQTHNEDLEGLRDTLVSHGLLQAVVVREIGRGRYELLAGHRRCAAARLAGWNSIRARIQEATDDQAREIVVIENLLRKDLSAVEEAKGFQAMLAGGHYATQEAIAQRLGCTQGHVANRLRYLRLPATWQEAIITGEIPHTYARAILPYCDDARAAAAIAGVRKKIGPTKAEAKKLAAGEEIRPLSYEELVSELAVAFHKAGTEVTFHHEHDKKTGQWIGLPDKLSDEQKKRLDVVEVKAPDRWNRDRVQAIALNRSAWFEIAREHHAKQEARAAGGKKKADKPEAEMTAAERRQAKDQEARNKKKRQEQCQRRRREISADWKRILIARALADPKRTGREVLMVSALHMTKAWRSSCSWDGFDFQDFVQEVCGGRESWLERLAAGGFAEEKIWEIARRFAVGAFVDEEGSPQSQVVPESDLDLLITWLSIDLAAAWEAEQMGDLSAAWWAAHDRDDLLKIGGGICVDSHMKKGEAVGALAASRSIDLPGELRPAKATAKGKRKPR